MEGHWLSISEYSNYRSISVSTIRRYIKGNRVKFKRDNGKYFIYVSDENYHLRKNKKDREELTLKMELTDLKDRIRELEEENNDLKMLISAYESKKNSSPRLPPVPPEYNA